LSDEVLAWLSVQQSASEMQMVQLMPLLPPSSHASLKSGLV